ncbi:Mce family protein [Gordonia effusa NBRC 100432]|uniref:Mce family protein n=1 Tax=Gordonia effusa NBRC 100432 TaxID=1077974 RepID=H0R4X4_9ACTN|nr:MlaD family protein [Gordonia effusa]GAB20125.1 Mce family protein [Gordonia effusa NBRC 100432]
MTQKRLLATIVGIVTVAMVVAVGVSGKQYYDSKHGPVSVCGIFRDAVGLYPGNKVTMLGIHVGNVERIETVDNHVKVEMTVDRDATLPAELGAVTITSSIVTDRHVELTPAYTGGSTFDTSKCIPIERTKTPVGFTESMRAITKLSNDITGKAPDSSDQDAAPDEVSRALFVLATQIKGSSKNLNGAIRNISGILGDTASAANFVLRQVLDNVGQISKGLDNGSNAISFAVSALTDGLNIARRVTPDVIGIINDISHWISPIANLAYKYGPTLIRLVDWAWPILHGVLSDVPRVVDILKQIPPAAQNLLKMFDTDIKSGRLQYRPPKFRVDPELVTHICGLEPLRLNVPTCMRDFKSGDKMDLGIVQLVLAAVGTEG